MVVATSAPVRRGALAAFWCAALAFGLAACGSSSGSSPGTNFNDPVYEIRSLGMSGLGTILIDGKGYSLYLFEPDHQSGKSACYGTCAVEWSPLTVPSSSQPPIAGFGVTASMLSTTHRTDGTIQVTYNGWPLYLWAQDTSPAEATGQGLDNQGGLWYVLDPAGNAITTRP